jgi:hypothetical protein
MPIKKSSTKPVTPTPSPAASAASPPVITTARTTRASRARVAEEVACQTLVTGLPVVFAGEATLVLPSGTYTMAELSAPFQKRIAAAEATKVAETQFHDAVSAEAPVAEAANALRKEVKQLAVARFGATGGALTQLGFEPAKARQVSAATKAGAAAKGKATREAKKAATAPVAPPAPAPKPAG